ncbi:hypothetical protein [Streptomyces sp. SID3343]|uniref:hypothetical protein n=1 Tax=Streptomyces sp. SID3343 TaxID=2690260 RepID=UPI001368FC27|nr:hypothetical protein [Streptomyces sp. SID3343]MYW00863.1 hypothetical protein [Streptomyces sp. SID3343]
MASKYGRTAAALTITAALTLTAAACGDDDNGGGDNKSAPTTIPSALESAGEDAKDALASASASAAAKLDEIKGGLDAKSDASIGRPEADGDRTKAEVTVDNKTDKTADYTLLVQFRNDDGKLLDAVVLTVDDVGAGKQSKATARSHFKLTGATKADVGRVIRH